MGLKAKWVWKNQDNYNQYNQTILARRIFSIEQIRKAIIKITADSYYRLYINGKWVNDGPARSWAENFQFDKIDITGLLEDGNNEIKIIARYYGIGTMHNIPQQAGLLVQLDIEKQNGTHQRVISDNNWEVASADGWLRNTPKIGIQMEPFEYYDARRESSPEYEKAIELFDAHNAPWKNLNPRDVALLSKKDFSFKSAKESNVVKSEGTNYCVPVTRLMHPNLVEANRHTFSPMGIATVIKTNKSCRLDLKTESFRQDYFKTAIDGKYSKNGRYNLSAGKHILLGFTRTSFCHDKEINIRFLGNPDITLENPLEEGHENPWCFIPYNGLAFAHSDMEWEWFFEYHPREAEKVEEFRRRSDDLLEKITDSRSFLSRLGNRARCLPSNEMFDEDIYWRFKERKVVCKAGDSVINPDGLMRDDSDFTTVNPNSKGDIELMYDLGEQNCGYYSLDLTAEAGVEIDIFGIEYISPDGKLQHTSGSRNGMRYITRKGGNRFVSLKRRSGRYIFITLRNQKSPVYIRNIKLIESTYPVDSVGGFECSDKRLNRIHQISERTLKLCMEDVFTDCPLYEQTLWVGDARNESLFAYGLFGARDIAKRCINLAAQSLKYYPMISAQVPSSWECILSAWSFLWGISVWDYYWFTGDREFLEMMWNPVIKNIKGAEKHIDDSGLFSAPFWNMFDWVDIDQQQKAVLHNSMLLVGCVNAALKCGEVLEDKKHKAYFEKLRASLCSSINNYWDESKGAYPDSLHRDGTVSDSTCQHTSFLAILYDIVEHENYQQALGNLTNPPENMVKVGSPFTALYLYETFEKAGLEEEIIKSIRKSYEPMLKGGATTVWEGYPGGTTGKDGFPTRSHCHGWSAAPVYFFNRIITGIRQMKPGGKSFEISPRIMTGLKNAQGSTATVNERVTVIWNIEGDNLNIKISHPENTEVKYVKNETHEDFRVSVNITKNQEGTENV